MLKQQQRAKILFKSYPDIKKAYNICQKLKNLFNNKTITKDIAYTKLAHWFKEVEESKFKAFNIVANSINLNYQSIRNYFDNRSTNASAESLINHNNFIVFAAPCYSLSLILLIFFRYTYQSYKKGYQPLI
ncbi:transposase [Tenacibaculum maritimum]|uniref:transposase n=1 Tax=Tenacibaculum maritimum TaxID=107401 RepID=UPI0021D29E68|nr:transposase [Tenacibaculum maritimum]